MRSLPWRLLRKRARALVRKATPPAEGRFLFGRRQLDGAALGHGFQSIPRIGRKRNTLLAPLSSGAAAALARQQNLVEAVAQRQRLDDVGKRVDILLVAAVWAE